MMVETIMMNPCYDCQKYREYGKYLDEVLICKPAVPEPVIPQKKTPKTVKPVSKVKPKPKPAPWPEDQVQCKMGGCKRMADGGKGYCNSCLAVRRYHENLGSEPPDKLTPAQIKRRDRKGV